MNGQPTIVLVEDDGHIRRFVRRALEDEGCAVFEAETGAKGLAETASRNADLVVLDLGLPDQDGCDFIRDLRQWADVPIIVLSARSNESDKIEALNAGADDYLSKPFGIGELVARVHALLRRRRSAPSAAESKLFAFGDVRVDFEQHQVWRADQPVHLTHTEYRLLCTLIANAGKVLTHRQLLQQVWGPGYADRSHYTRIFVGRLRQKLEADPAQPQFIFTETGVGYRFRA
jgi:two-component system KDP operon response regulator KdpE